MKFSKNLVFNLPQSTDKAVVDDINANFEKIDGLFFLGLTDEMLNTNIYGIVAPSAVVNYVNTKVADKAKGEQVYFETLDATSSNKIIDVSSHGLTGGAKIMLRLPPNTTLPNNRVSLSIRFEKLADKIERRIAIYAEGIKSNTAYSTCIFNVIPLIDVWNIEVAPYQKTLNTIQGDDMKHDGDAVITVQFQTNDTNPLPVGTEITIWRV